MTLDVAEVHHNVENLSRIYKGLAKTCRELASGEYVAATLSVACDSDVGYEIGSLRDRDGNEIAWSPSPGSALYPTQLYLETVRSETDAIAVIVTIDLTDQSSTTSLFTGLDARRWMEAAAARHDALASGAADALPGPAA